MTWFGVHWLSVCGNTMCDMMSDFTIVTNRLSQTWEMSKYAESHIGKAERIPVVWLLLMLPTTDVFVLLSIKQRFFKSTERLKCRRKSALMMGDFTSAISNVQGKFHPIPKFIFNAVVPKVWMVVPFAASNVLLLIEVL